MKRDKSVFHFKQFAVKHSATALKVTTDAVVFGSWIDFSGATTILDIGTGSGVLALMAAQKNANAAIYAVEIDEKAAAEAAYNFQQSKFSNRLTLFNCDFNDFNSEEQFDLIISNPPYFHDTLLSKNEKVAVAKHTVSLSHSQLLHGTSKLLAEQGKAFFVLPFSIHEQFCILAKSFGLYCNHLTSVSSSVDKSPYLALVSLEKKEKPIATKQFYLFEKNGAKSVEYQSLSADFYL